MRATQTRAEVESERIEQYLGLFLFFVVFFTIKVSFSIHFFY